MVWPGVTQPMSKSCSSTTSGIFSLTNVQEEVGIGITTLSREYPSNVVQAPLLAVSASQTYRKKLE